METKNPKIYEQIIKAAGEIEAIGKDQYNKMQNFSYRGIDDIYNKLHPILTKHKLFTIPRILEERMEERTSKNGGKLIYRILKVRYRIFTDDGSGIQGDVIGEGMDSGDKAANKAMAIAHKYFLSQVFTIPTGDDPDGDSPQITGEKTPATKTTSTPSADIKCNVCGATMYLSKTKSKKGNEYYYCSRYKEKPPCKNLYFPESNTYWEPPNEKE